MDTLFFVIQVCGLIAIVFWAHRNDGCAEIAAQDGLLAMLAPCVSESGAAKSAPRTAPPRRRFARW